MTEEPLDTAAQFSRQAEVYRNSPSHAHGKDLDIVAEFAQASSHERCLDVATGPGHTALRIAESAGQVIGIDIAGGMIAAARRQSAERGIRNAFFHLADVQALPFSDQSFDLVTCRIAAHHFSDLPRGLREIFRVLKPGGRFVLEDSLGSADPQIAAYLERLEKWRDPTHVHSLNHKAWLAALGACGFAVTRETVFAKDHDFDLWIRRTGLPAATIGEICQDILGAEEPIRMALFTIRDERIAHLHDQKLIVRAERPPST